MSTSIETSVKTTQVKVPLLKLLCDVLGDKIRILDMLRCLHIKATVHELTFDVIQIRCKVTYLILDSLNTYTKHLCGKAIKIIKVFNAKAHDYSASEAVEHWVGYTFDSDLKCLDNTMNFVKSFNGMIERYMCKPICTF